MRTSKQTVLAEVRPIIGVLVSCVRSAADAYNQLNVSAELKPVMLRGPEGMTLYHFIWYFLEQQFGGEGPFRIVIQNGLKVLFVESLGVGIRVNKLDAYSHEGPLSKGAGTLRDDPQMYLEFYDGPAGNLTLGHTMRRGELYEVLMSLQSENGVEWELRLDDLDDNADGQPENPMPVPPPAPEIRPRAYSAGQTA